MKKNLLLVLVSLLLFGCNTSTVDPQTNIQDSLELLEESTSVEPTNETGTVSENENLDLELSEESQELLNAQIIDFSTEKLLEIQGEQKFLIFFHADWCSTCVKWKKSVKENLRELPQNTVILIADYDNKSIRNAFGVSRQSTAIFYDLEGQRVDDILDPSIEDLISFFSS